MTDTQRDARIVVGVDGSYYSKLALRWAVYLADRTGARIEAILAWQNPRSFSREWHTAVPTEEMHDYVHKTLTEAVDDVLGTQRPTQLRLLAQEGTPARVLIERSHDATMLVVGSRGHGGFATLMLGSVSARCVAHGRCPVLVVHASEPPVRG